jgi:hypothetical protein
MFCALKNSQTYTKPSYIFAGSLDRHIIYQYLQYRRAAYLFTIFNNFCTCNSILWHVIILSAESASHFTNRNRSRSSADATAGVRSICYCQRQPEPGCTKYKKVTGSTVIIPTRKIVHVLQVQTAVSIRIRRARATCIEKSFS